MRNIDWVNRSRNVVWQPCTQMKFQDIGTMPMIPIARGFGPWLYDYEGNRYLDAISSWWVNLFGHSNPRIITAINKQLQQLEHVMLAGFTHEAVITLSERLTNLTKGELGHCFYASDGSSAVEIALKMSFHYWHNIGQSQKSNFVCLSGSYHGETIGTLEISNVSLYKEIYIPLLRGFAYVVPSPDTRCVNYPGESAVLVAERAAIELKKCLEKHHSCIAALIIEPLVQGSNGMVIYDAHYIKLAKSLCDYYNIHFICDEIMVGFGRTGTFFAHEQANIRPDFLCLSKGLTGGYLPLSVVMTTEKIYETFYDNNIKRAFLHSHSYSGNPLACSAALATLSIFEEDNIIIRNKDFANQFNQLVKPLAHHHMVRNFRQCGMIWAMDIDTNDDNFRIKFYQEIIKNGILLRPLGNTIYFMPPYVLCYEDMLLLINNTVKVLDTLF